MSNTQATRGPLLRSGTWKVGLVALAASTLILSGCSIVGGLLGGIGSSDSYSSEGSVDSPVVIDMGTAVSHARTGEVGSIDSSYYELQAQADHRYTITLQNLEADADLTVYSDAEFLNEIASSSDTGTSADEVTVETAGSASLYVEVTPFTGGTTFELAIQDEGTILSSEGSASSPVDIGDASSTEVTYEGQVTDSTDSYYMVTVASGTNYDVAMTGLSSDIDLYVYDDSDFSFELDSSVNLDTSDELVSGVSTSGTTLYIKTHEAAGGGSTFTLAVGPSAQ